MSNAYAADCYSTFDRQGYRNRSGSLAIFTPIRRASSFAEVLCCRGVASATRFHYCLDFRPFVLLLKTFSNWRMTLAA